MIKFRPGRAALLGAALAASWLASAYAQTAPPAPAAPRPAPIAQTTLTVGYLEIEGDPRYDPITDYDRTVVKRPERPISGAEVGFDEAKPLARVTRTDFVLARLTAKSAADLPALVQDAIATRGIHFFVVDLPGDAYIALAAAVKGRDVLLFNVSAPDDSLRRTTCAAEFVHVIPSLAMTSDALGQFLVARKWRDVLVLEGPQAADTAAAAAFTASAKKFGVRIVADQHFEPGNDPRQRDKNNPALLTAVNRDYDVVYVADSAFEFARQVSYRTVRPRPVIGSIDLEPVAWHWAWDHNGAPQVTSRLAAKAGGRRMEGGDWAAWVAAKMIVQSVVRTKSNDFTKQRDFILGAEFDGDKGLAVSVRPWDHQVRQAVLLAAPYSVVASAPMEGFLHRSNELDTLGDDRDDTPCHLDQPR